MANIVWSFPQFSLASAALRQNLLPSVFEGMSLTAGNLVSCLAVALACTPTGESPPSPSMTVAEDIAARRAQFVPKVLDADVTHLSEGDDQRTLLRSAFNALQRALDA